MRFARHTYVIEKVAPSTIAPRKQAGQWRIASYVSSSVLGTILGYYPSRKAARVSASLLAGRTADVIIWKGYTS